MSRVVTLQSLNAQEKKEAVRQGALIAKSTPGTLDDAVVKEVVDEVDHEGLSQSLKLLENLPIEVLRATAAELMIQSGSQEAVTRANIDQINYLETNLEKTSAERDYLVENLRRTVSPDKLLQIQKQAEERKIQCSKRNMNQLQILQNRVRRLNTNKQ